jgi:hypothetical protein
MVVAVAMRRILRKGAITMSYSSVSNSSGSTSPWQALQDQGSTVDGSSSNDSVWAASFPPPPPTTAEAGATDGSGTSAASGTSTRDPSNLDSSLAQLIASLQSFLVNLQSTNGTDTTASTGTTDSSTVAASSAAASTTATASAAGTDSTDSTASTTATQTTADLFADLGTILGDLQASFGSQPPGPPGQDPSQVAATDQSTSSTGPTQTTTQSAGSAEPPQGHHDLLADLLNAVQSYAAQSTQTEQLGATASVTA